MTLPGPGSVTRALTKSLVVGLSLLWLLGVVGSGVVLKRLIDEKSDDELMESAAIMMSLVRHTDDLLVAAAVLGEVRTPYPHGAVHERFVYQVRDTSGRVLLRSHNAPPALADAALAEGFDDVGDWRVATVADPGSGRVLQLADPLAERRAALVHSMLWLTLPLAALLAFAVLIVFRASRTLVRQVQRTASAVSRQDPQALGMLPLDGVVTEMKPAVEAANRLFARFADAFETERSFTYNSAHELRTPIAAALAQAQLLAAMAEDSPLKAQADATVAALRRLSRLAERLLALARAEGTAPLADEWVDLAQVARLVADEFRHSGRLQGRRLVVDATPVRVRGDFDAVGLAVRNLVENALVHGSGGTAIRVTCRDDGRAAIVAVVDDGPGIPGAQIPALLKRFARGSAAKGTGAGLGLSIVDTLARRMGARLVLTSPPAGHASGLDARLVWEAPG
ncbi:MAG: HAMP domain-containing histidine kinase [Betaproteobacteria bacterium]|nr:HAMP domain-containing histidine kinase [Betaproteobacteria bacterium]